MPSKGTVSHQNKVIAIPKGDQDGGWAWVILAAAFIWMTIVGGMTSSTGILYVEFMERYDELPSKTALVSSANYIVYSVSACLSGYLSDKIPMALPVIIASIVGALSTVYAGFSPSLLGVILTLGALNGLCRGAIQSPALGSLGRYFISKRTFASSFAVSGASLGVLVIPLVLRFTLDEYGLPGATFVLGGFMLQGCIIGMALKPLVPVVVEVTANQELKEVQPKGQDEEEERLNIEQSEPAVVVSTQETSANRCCRLLHEMAFLLNPLLLRTLVAMFFCGMAYLNWYVFVAAYVKEIGLSKADASLFVSLTGVAELVSRPIAGFLIAKFALNKTVLLTVYCCIALLVCVAFAFLPVWFDYDRESIFWSFAVLSVILSITGGYFFALMMPLVVDAVAPKDLGRAVGMLPLVLGSGAAVGTQILSSIEEATGSFQTVQWCIGLCYMPAIMLLLWNIVSHRRTVRTSRSLNS